MSDHTIPDALAADLRALFIADSPLTTALPEASLRLKLETTDLPSPRILFLVGDPKRIQGQDYTARVPFTLTYISSMDRETPAAHRAIAGEIDQWLREIRLTKRRAVLDSLTWLHDLYNMHPVISIRADDREQVAELRGEAVVTLAVTTPAV